MVFYHKLTIEAQVQKCYKSNSDRPKHTMPEARKIKRIDPKSKAKRTMKITNLIESSLKTWSKGPTKLGCSGFRQKPKTRKINWIILSGCLQVWCWRISILRKRTRKGFPKKRPPPSCRSHHHNSSKPNMHEPTVQIKETPTSILGSPALLFINQF